MVKILFLILFLVASNLASKSQQECKVLLEEISESYDGSCRRGLAHGKGEAGGIDRYSGEFRKGLPHGYGDYNWSDGSKYKGYWKEGIRHGKGRFTYEVDGRKISYSGMWRKDEFIGHEKTPPYSPGHMLGVERYSIRRVSDGNMILVGVYEKGMLNPFPGEFIFHLDTGSSITVGQLNGYEELRFPAEVKISYAIADKLQQGLSFRVRFEVTINDPGIWEIKLYH